MAHKNLLIGDDHCFDSVRMVQSPNFDSRPTGIRITLIVIHAISLPPGKFGNGHVEALFTNCLDKNVDPTFEELVNVRVSSHLYLTREGVLTQFVPFDKRAWHAGESHFRGRRDCNDFSIGIELEGAIDVPFTDLQYSNLVSVVCSLRSYYETIPLSGVVGHSEIAPDRKWDPGPQFDWCRFMDMLLVKERNTKSVRKSR